MNTKDLKVLGLAFICLSLIASLQSCATQGLPPEESLLANEELVEFFRVPQTAKVTTRNGMGTIKYTPDGVQTYQAFESGFFDTGKYRIVDNTICGSWTEIRSGKEACSKVYKVGEKTYRFIDTNGKNAGTLKFK